MLRAAIFHDQTEWTPENYDPDERVALEEALQIQREAEIIAFTHWTFAQYDDAPAGRLARMMEYIGLKNRIEKEKSDFDASRGGGMTGGRR